MERQIKWVERRTGRYKRNWTNALNEIERDKFSKRQTPIVGLGKNFKRLQNCSVGTHSRKISIIYESIQGRSGIT